MISIGLQALDVYWHEDCLKCGCCDCRLGEVGSTLYTRANLILCKRDYLRYQSPASQSSYGQSHNRRRDVTAGHTSAVISRLIVPAGPEQLNQMVTRLPTE